MKFIISALLIVIFVLLTATSFIGGAATYWYLVEGYFYRNKRSNRNSYRDYREEKKA